MLEKGDGPIPVGMYGVRTIGQHGEKILHAPKSTKGRFVLFQYADGTLEYRPVK